MVIEKQFETKRDEFVIRGKYYYQEDKTNLIPLIICHGYMSSIEETKIYGPLFAEKGFACFVFDFVGGGPLSTSDGKTTDMTLNSEVEDLESVIEYVSSLDFVDSTKINIMGNSQGGLVVGLTAAKLQERISKLIMLYPGFLLPRVCKSGHILFFDFDPDNVPEILEQDGLSISGRYIKETQQLDSYGEVKKYKGPTLIVHGTGDDLVPYTDSEKAKEVMLEDREDKDSVKLVLIDGAKHGFEGDEVKQCVEEVCKFINE